MSWRATQAARRASFNQLQTFERVGEARAALENDAGLIALVRREHFRNAVMRCPCGCGDVLVVNLDPEAGRAWRARVQHERLTLLPSVWRDSGCKSHFVLWENRVWWCNLQGDEPEDQPWPEVVRVTVRAWWRRTRRTARRKRNWN